MAKSSTQRKPPRSTPVTSSLTDRRHTPPKQSAATSCELKDYACHAKMQGLRYVTDQSPGFTRTRKGKGFLYLDTNGKQIVDTQEIARIHTLAIPPAYTQVWICPHPNVHIQATGLDARGRKQYRYHTEWRAVRDTTKFAHILAFGEALPTIRVAAQKDLAAPQLTREKVLATVVTLLEKTSIRVGNEEYAKQNHSYGLTTLRERHLEMHGDTIRFRFKGKSGKEWNVKLNDRRIAKVLRACEEIEGQELFKYKDETGTVHTISSTDVNHYLQEITGEPFTAKDYRTWTGTVLAAMALREYERYDSEAQAKKNILAAIDHVSKQLGNTPTICRKCYIHPEIITAYLDGSLVTQITQEIDASLKAKHAHLSPEEILVLTFLKKRLKQ